MPLPTVAATAPDLSAFISQARARADGLAQAGWAGLNQALASFGSPSAIAPSVGSPTGPKEAGGYASEMASWGKDAPGWNQGFEGFADNVPRSLINTESGGNWGARNNEAGSGGSGHFGILQFGHGRLADAKKAGVIPADMTPEQFIQSREAQVKTANWHFSDIDNRIRANGYDQLVGQIIGGTPITMDGMRAMAHLGGFGGLSKFIRSGGSHNPADAYGTSLAHYGKTHSSYAPTLASFGR